MNLPRRFQLALPVLLLALLLATAGPAMAATDAITCEPDGKTLCLNQSRFEVRAIWGDYDYASGAGAAHALSADTGYFHFFSPNNVEVMVKVLDGCAADLGHHYWVFAAGLTDVQVELRVKDTWTGAFQIYTNTRGTTFDPVLDVEAFATCDAPEPPGFAAEAATRAVELPAAPAAATGPGSHRSLEAELCDLFPVPRLCLAGRFSVTTRYRTPGGESGNGFGHKLTADTGAFYFYDSNNFEVLVKVLDACSEAYPGYWVFAAGLTDIEVEVEIQDLVTGQIKVYQRGPGPFAPLVDLGSFPCD